MTGQQDASVTLAGDLSQYVSQEILGDGSIVSLEQNLLGEGIIDSLGMLRLAGYIEASYGVQIPPEHYVIENFRNLLTISDYVLRRQAGETS